MAKLLKENKTSPEKANRGAKIMIPSKIESLIIRSFNKKSIFKCLKNTCNILISGETVGKILKKHGLNCYDKKTIIN